MLRRIALAFLLMISAIAPAVAETALLPGDAKNGKQLHDVQCVACHNTGVYTRKERRVQTLGGLIKQVEACNRQLDKQLSREQVNDLIAYLNESFYRFE